MVDTLLDQATVDLEYVPGHIHLQIKEIIFDKSCLLDLASTAHQSTSVAPLSDRARTPMAQRLARSDQATVEQGSWIPEELKVLLGPHPQKPGSCRKPHLNGLPPRMRAKLRQHLKN